MGYDLSAKYDEKTDFRWWRRDAYSEHDAVTASVAFIKDRDVERQNANLHHLRLYGNLAYSGVNSGKMFTSATKDRVTLNVIKAAADTVTAKVAKNRPRPSFLTQGGNRTMRRKARTLERWVDAQFYLSGFYDIMPQLFLDTCVFGTGIVKPYRDGKEICFDRVFPSEVYVDYADGLHGKPTQFFQQKSVPKDVLLETYCGDDEDEDEGGRCEEIRRAIYSAVSVSEAGGADRNGMSEQVLVTEAWRLATKHGPGRRVICIDGCTLVSEPYKYTYPPFVIVRWSNKLRGFWGSGLAEELSGIQSEINMLLVKIQQHFKLMSSPTTFVEMGSKVVPAHLTNNPGDIVYYVGQRPITEAVQSTHPEIFQHLERLYAKAFEIAGIALDALHGQIPSGLETGQAVREYRDLGSERFSIVSRAWEEAHMTAARMTVDLGREIAASYSDYDVVTQKDKYTISRVPWEEVDLEDDAYVLKVYPASSLPSSPAGRQAAVNDLMLMGIINRDQAARLIDFPDIDSETSLARAAADYIDMAVERMLDDGVYVPPEPFDNLVMALERVTGAYNQARCDEVPEERLALLRKYLQQAALLLPDPAAPAASGPPPAAPEMPQQSTVAA